MRFRYHVPRSWLKPTKNLLIVFEELGGDVSQISFVKRSVTSVCADVSEWHPNVKNLHIESYGKSEEFHKPKVHLRCAPGQFISAIKFASFGTPLGTCGSFQQGTCHAPTSYAILEKVLKTALCFYRLPVSVDIYISLCTVQMPLLNNSLLSATWRDDMANPESRQSDGWSGLATCSVLLSIPALYSNHVGLFP